MLSQWSIYVGSPTHLWLALSSAAALIGLILRRATRSPIPTLIFALASVWAGQQIVAHSWVFLRDPLWSFVWSCAGLSLWWTVVAGMDGRTAGSTRSNGSSPTNLATLARTVALLLGAAAAVVIVFVLTVQGVYMLLDLIRGYPAVRLRDFGFDASGLVPTDMLLGAAVLGYVITRDRRLPACILGCVTLAAAWSSLLIPHYQPNATGGVELSPSLLVLTVLLSLIMAISSWLACRRKDPAEGRSGAAHDSLQQEALPPGLSVAFTLLALAVTALTTYHLLVPIKLGSGGEALTGVVLAAESALAAAATLITLRRHWSPYRADAGITLVSLSLCACATVLVPRVPTALTDRYPMIFNAIMIGLIAGVIIFVFRARKLRENANGATEESYEWRLSGWLLRFAFFNAALALVAGAMMAIWPELPTVATMDDSLGRVAVGTATNLLLVLVLIWCARRLRQSTIHGLTVMAVIATCAFVIVRLLPFASTVG